MASAPADPEREYRLIEQLELRIASANTDEKFQSIVQKFLAALLLKLGSPTPKNRTLTMKVCQHVLQRLKIDTSIQIPIPSLIKAFKETDAPLVKQFTLVFIEQGLARTQSESSTELLPDLLRFTIPESDDIGPSEKKMWSIAFEFLLKTLQTWGIPAHDTKEDIELRDHLALSHSQCNTLSTTLAGFLLYDSKVAPKLPRMGEGMLTICEKLQRTRQYLVHPIAKFLSLAVFTDEQRLVPATILSVDRNASASSLADTMFKQCNFELEENASVDALFALFDLAQPKLQTRILTLLSHSSQSTQRAPKVLDIVEKQLFSQATGLEAAKLRAAVFSYLTWAVRASQQLNTVSSDLQAALKHFVELQGWPTMQEPSHTEADLRAKAYESIGLLSTVRSNKDAPAPTVPIDLIAWLFTSLRCDTSKDVKGSIDEALSRVLGATTAVTGDEQERLVQLLLWNVTAEIGDEDPVYFLTTQTSTRYMAVRFANKCLAFADVDARFIDLVALAKDDRREVVEEATRGLDPYWSATEITTSVPSTKSQILQFPSFEQYVDRITKSGGLVKELDGRPSSLASAVTFGRCLLATEALDGTFLDVRSESEWATQIEALISNDRAARAKIKAYLKTVNQDALVGLLQCSILGLSRGSTECAVIALEQMTMAPNRSLSQLSPTVIDWCRSGLEVGAVQTQAARVLGIVASLSGQSETFAMTAFSSCSNWQVAIGQESVSIRGQLLAASFIATRQELRHANSLTDSFLHQLFDLCSSIITDSRDKALVHAAYIALGQICICTSGRTLVPEKLTSISNTLLADAKKESEIAVTALGRTINALRIVKADEKHDSQLERLYALHEVRRAEFQFAVGEAMAVAALGFSSASTITEFDVEAPMSGLGLHRDLFESILDRCLADSATTKPSLKKASAIWLLCIIQYCTSSDLLQPRLRDCQAAFARLLTDRDEVVQETGSRGLGLVYEKGDRKLRDDLVHDLVQSFTGGGAKMSGTVNEDTQLFEAGALPTEGGHSVTTYKDIVSLATEMGDPSLVYRFMNLASNNAIWTSRAAFGRFGLSTMLADSSYLSENKKFYPKLFRYRFDPNPNVQRAMDDIWKALVKDPNKILEENFDLIMDDLLISVLSGKEWRAREASCGAIADLIQGREVEKFEKYLDEVWKVAFKVLDDVKETVRLAAMRLCRTLTSMLIRNLEVGHGVTKRASIMLNHAIPFLLQQMEGGAAQEVQQYAVATLLEVIKKSPPQSLQEFAPVILETLILSLSSLEHESINYLHLNADKYGLTAEKLDKMRVSSINASPVSDAIERCLDSLTAAKDIEMIDANNARDTDSKPTTTIVNPVQDTMRRLEKAFKSAIGLPSKVGLSRVMVTLVVRHQTMFRPFADRFVQLTRKNLLDRNATISVSFSMALAYLVRVASEKEVQETCRYAQKLYFDSQELSHRAVAGEVVQAISKASNDVFMRFATSFLPFAFIGCSDLDQDVQARFEPAWKDNIGGSRALNLYLSEIVELIAVHITSNLWPIRQACCLAVADLVSSMDPSGQYTKLDATALWAVMEEALGGKTWAGKEKVISAFPRFVKKSQGVAIDFNKQIWSITLREARRKNAAYRPHAITALGEIASCRPDLDLGETGLGVLVKVADELAEDDEDAMDIDGDETSRSRLVDETYVAVIKCLLQILTTEAGPNILDAAMDLIMKVRDANSSTAVDMEIFDGSRRFITQIYPDVSSLEGRRRSSSEINGGQARDKQRALLEGFSQHLILAAFERDRIRNSSDIEKLRRSRVELALGLSETGLLRSNGRNKLTQILEEWLRAERSRPIKAEIEKAIAELTK